MPYVHHKFWPKIWVRRFILRHRYPTIKEYAMNDKSTFRLLRACALCALLVLCQRTMAQSFSESFSGNGAESSEHVVQSGFEEPGWVLGLNGSATATFDIPNGELDIDADDTFPSSFLARVFAGAAPLETTWYLNDVNITADPAATNILVFAVGDHYSASILDTDSDPGNNWIVSIVAMGAPITEFVEPMYAGTNVSFGWKETADGLVDFLYDYDTTDPFPAESLVQFTNPCATATCALDDTNRNVAFSFFPATANGVVNFGFDRHDGTIGAELSSLPEDFDDDGDVDFSDFVAFSNVFGQDVPPADAVFDLNGNGSVDFTDFVQFSNAFGTTAGVVSVPEPAISTLLCLGLLAVVGQRRTR